MFRKSLAAGVIATLAFAQPPRLDNPLGPAGGVKVECISGCAGGGGGGDVNIDAIGGNAVTTTIPVSGSVGVDNFPVTQAVTGTFWQATQPISGTVAVSNFPGSQAVTGTFWQATQPVSGTFWQATQPVSIASMPTTPVTGTISQATSSPGSDSITLTTTAANLGTQVTTKILIQNDPDNAVDIFCGSVTRQDFQLKPGDALGMDVTNLNLIYCKSASGSIPANVIWR